MTTAEHFMRHVAERTVSLVWTACAVLLMIWAPALAQDEGPSPYWFEVEDLNPGLGPAPDNLDRDTPQMSLDGFIEATRAKDYDRAAHYLDVSRLERNLQASEGAKLAHRLAEVIERKLWLDWGSLSDRPDALVETGSSDNPLAGKPMRSQRLGILEADNRPVIIRLNRVKPKNGAPVWVFANTTVERIPALYARHQPGWFERMIPESWNQRIGDWELRIWELVLLPLGIAATIAFFLILRWAFGILAEKAPWGVVRHAAAAARMPAALVIAASAARIVLGGIITFSGAISSIFEPVLLALIIIGVAMAILRVIDAVLDQVTRRMVGDIDDDVSRGDRQLYTSIYAIRRIVVLLAFVAGVGLLLQQLHLTETLGVSLLASAGVVTVLLGIAGQSVLGNIFSSLQLAIAKPIRIGDAIEYDGTWSYVEAIYYTYVRLRTWDDRRLIVPVKEFVSNSFINYSKVDEKTTRTFDIWLDHDADPSEVRKAWEEMLEAHEDIMPDETNQMLTMGHDHNGQMLRFYLTSKDPSTSWDAHAELREEILKWVRDNHPEWWPRERVSEAEGLGQTGGAVGDAGG